VFIALTFGSNQKDVPLAGPRPRPQSSSWHCAGVALRAPLARVPENSLKFVVGVMLTSFGCSGVVRAGACALARRRAALLVIVPLLLLFSLGPWLRCARVVASGRPQRRRLAHERVQHS